MKRRRLRSWADIASVLVAYSGGEFWYQGCALLNCLTRLNSRVIGGNPRLNSDPTGHLTSFHWSNSGSTQISTHLSQSCLKYDSRIINLYNINYILLDNLNLSSLKWNLNNLWHPLPSPPWSATFGQVRWTVISRESYLTQLWLKEVKSELSQANNIQIWVESELSKWRKVQCSVESELSREFPAMSRELSRVKNLSRAQP